MHYRAEEKLAKTQATYGTGSCVLLKINSRQPGSVVLGDNPWSRVARHYTSTNGEVCVCVCVYSVVIVFHSHCVLIILFGKFLLMVV